MNQPVYQVVYVFERYPFDDFIERGIYTKKEDAEEHQKLLREAGAFIVAIVERTHEQLCNALADRRLGVVAEHLRKLLDLPLEEREKIVELRGASDLPIAVAVRDS